MVEEAQSPKALGVDESASASPGDASLCEAEYGPPNTSEYC